MALFRHVLTRRRMRREYPAPQSALRSPWHIGRFLAVELDIEPAAAQSRGLGRVQLELAGNVAAGGFGNVEVEGRLAGHAGHRADHDMPLGGIGGQAAEVAL